MVSNPHLRRDERGAIMLLALYFAIFGVALLYTVVGAAETTFFRERLQDAADAVALSSAVMHARSMNFIVLLNILMAALLAILVTIKLIEGLAIVGIAIAVGLSWATFGLSLAAVPPLSVLQADMESTYGVLKDPIFDALAILHDVASNVQAVAPAAAQGAAADDLEYWKPPVEKGVVVSAADELPIEDGSFGKLCDEAGALPMELAGEALKPVGVQPVLDALAPVMQGLTDELQQWFCGSDGQPPKPYPYSTDPVYPVASNDCLETKSQKDCEVAHKIEKQGRPDPQTGECDAEADCSLGGPYDERVKRARVECDPTKPDPPQKYMYQTRQATVPYFWTGKSWIHGEPVFEPPELVEAKQAPCAPKPFVGTIGSTYNTVVRTTNDVDDVQPVCSNDQPPSSFGHRAGETVRVQYVEVRHILACERHEEHQVNLDVSGGQGGSAAQSEDVPKRVLSTATLGDEHFQIRTVMIGDTSRLRAENLVRLALRGRKPPDDPTAGLADVNGRAVAQAEYFFDGSDRPDEWMWKMSWRARLRRFRLPDEARDKLKEACGESCSDFVDRLSGLTDVITH